MHQRNRRSSRHRQRSAGRPNGAGYGNDRNSIYDPAADAPTWKPPAFTESWQQLADLNIQVTIRNDIFPPTEPPAPHYPTQYQFYRPPTLVPDLIPQREAAREVPAWPALPPPPSFNNTQEGWGSESWEFPLSAAAEETSGRSDTDKERPPTSPHQKTLQRKRGREEVVHIDDDSQSEEEDAQDILGKLPAHKKRASILSTVKKNQITIICGDTGSGKSTQVPQFILDEALKSSKDCKIVCTQPRRIAAISIAKRVAAERGEQLGDTVGYQIGMDKQVGQSTKLTFVTTGVLKHQIVSLKSLSRWTHIILDEVHERDLDSDFVMVMIKELLAQDRNVKLIIMSATLDSELFANYFPLAQRIHNDGYLLAAEKVSGKPAPVVRIGGRCYPVKVHFLEDVLKILGDSIPSHHTERLLSQRLEEPAIQDAMYELVVTLVVHLDRLSEKDEAREAASVLIFLPGYTEIQEQLEAFQSRASVDDFWLLPLHSNIGSEEQSLIFQAAPKNKRKVILSTNIAESSLTVPDVRYLIDFGFTKEIYYDSRTNLESLQLQWMSKASGKQRKGRAGRIGPGTAFRLFSRDFWKQDLPAYSAPEMQRCPLESLVLQAKKLKPELEPEDLLAKALQPPELTSIRTAINNLQNAGALTEGSVITHLGEMYASMPVDIRVSRLCFLGKIFDCLPAAVIMGAAISQRSVFTRPFGRAHAAYASKLKWAEDCASDTLTAMNVYVHWERTKMNRGFYSKREEFNWARDNYVHQKTLGEIKNLVLELTARLRTLGVYLEERSYKDFIQSYGNNNDECMKKLLYKVVLYGAFYPNYLESQMEDSKEIAALEEDRAKGILRYDPRRTITISCLPSDSKEHKIRQLLSQCGRISHVEILGTAAHVEFEDENQHRRLSPPTLYQPVVESLKVENAIKMAMRLRSQKWYYSQTDIETTLARGAGPATQPRRPGEDYFDEIERPLRGPEYPYCLRWKGMSVSDYHVGVERDSVNAVVFASLDSQHHPRYLVGAFAYQSQHGGSIYMRDTTLMPDIPLLGTLLAMVFTPSFVEFRTNSKHTKYLGALVGCKLEFNFDAQFKTEDINLLNRLRALISDALSRRGGLQHVDSRQLQQELFSLLLKERRRMMPRMDPNYQYSMKETSISDEWLSKEEEEERAWKRKAERDRQQRTGRSNSVLAPLVPPNPPVREEEASEVDSDDEARKEKKRIIDSTYAQLMDRWQPRPHKEVATDDTNLRNDAISPRKLESEAKQTPEKLEYHQLPERPELQCGVCHKVLCPLDGLKRVTPGSIPWGDAEKEKETQDEDEGAVFEVTKCFGYVWTAEDKATCRVGHAFGRCVAARKYVDRHSNVSVLLPTGERRSWGPQLWRNEFEAIGGVGGGCASPSVGGNRSFGSSPSPSPSPSSLAYAGGGRNNSGNDGRNADTQGYMCTICQKRCRTRREFVVHLASRRHKEEEEHFWANN